MNERIAPTPGSAAPACLEMSLDPLRLSLDTIDVQLVRVIRDGDCVQLGML